MRTKINKNRYKKEAVREYLKEEKSYGDVLNTNYIDNSSFEFTPPLEQF